MNHQPKMTAVTVYEQFSDPVIAVREIGRAIAKSKIFGCANEEQGQVLALECFARRMPPLMLAEQYDIIQGRLSMKADAMLAGFRREGGSYEIKEYSPAACEVVFERDGQKLPIRITWEDAQAERWPYGKEGQVKDNWATPIGRQDMLWARVVSRGVRRLAPEVVSGRYTPEEIADFDDGRNGSAVDVPYEVAPVGGGADVISEPQQTAESVPVEDAPVEEEQPASDEKYEERLDDPCPPELAEEVKSAIKRAAQAGVEDLAKRVKAKLADAGLSRITDLTIGEAEALLASIENKEVEAFFEQSISGHSGK